MKCYYLLLDLVSNIVVYCRYKNKKELEMNSVKEPSTIFIYSFPKKKKHIYLFIKKQYIFV